MFCPNCKSEYMDGVVACHDCGVSLIDHLEVVPHPVTKLVTVLADGNPGIIALAKSILEDAGIFYFVKGEEEQNLFGIGTIGTGFNPITGPMEVMVKEEDRETAVEFLGGLPASISDSEEQS